MFLLFDAQAHVVARAYTISMNLADNSRRMDLSSRNQLKKSVWFWGWGFEKWGISFKLSSSFQLLK
jgi:hypothetical protein